jgi:hypothetical protein
MSRNQKTFCVKRRIDGGMTETVIASGIDTLSEAADIAYRLTILRQQEFGGKDEFCAYPED